VNKIEKLLRITYIVVAFLSALSMRIGAGDISVFAQDRTSITQPQQFNMESYLTERMDHVEATQISMDIRLRDLNDKVTTLSGIGEGAFGVLGILQILGFINKLNNKGKEEDNAD
jgi:hypothetical protein